MPSKGKVGVQRGRENMGVPSFLLPPRARQSPPWSAAKLSARVGRTAFAVRAHRRVGTAKRQLCACEVIGRLKYSAPSPQQGGLLGRFGACRHKGALPHACRPVRWWIRFAAAKPRWLKQPTGLFLRATFRIRHLPSAKAKKTFLLECLFALVEGGGFEPPKS